MNRSVPPRAAAAVLLLAVLSLPAAVCAGDADPAPAEAEADTLHASAMTPLSPDGPFPRFAPGTLAASGYPDPMHAFFQPGWSAEPGEDGVVRGPGTLCSRRSLVEDPGLVEGEGLLEWRGLALRFNPGYAPCDVAVAMELCDWARARTTRLLGIEAPGRLNLINSDDLEDYASRTGYGNWRTFRLQGDDAVLEPVPVLVGRTLIAHAAVDLVTEWMLRSAGGDRLPPWLLHGLSGYVAESGAHYLNYMNFLAANGEPTAMSPAEIDMVLGSPPHPDAETDRWRYRRARYSAFLMAWHLIEGNGGLAPVRALLDALAAGADPDAACREQWGADLAGLAARLDPTAVAPPVPLGVAYPNPSRPPR